MRISLVASLAWQDYRADVHLSACAVLALVAVIAPLMVLFGLKFGLISSLTQRLEQDPAVREIIPMGGGRFSASAIYRLGQRPDVAFVIPRTRQIAATAEVRQAPQGPLINVEMIPSAAGDPLLGAQPAPGELNDVLMSQTAAEKLQIRSGDWLEASFSRQVGGVAQAALVRVRVIGVLPLAAFERDALFVSLPLLEAAEDYRDGRQVPALGWPGDAASTPEQRVYPGFRLYARSLDDVETLRLHFAEQGLSVSTQAQAIAQVRSLSHNLSIVFWTVAGLATSGACAAVFAGALAAVQRKRRELSVLRLLGLSTGALLLFVVLQATYSAALASLLAAALYGLAEAGLNHLFKPQVGEYASHLMPAHYFIALLAVLVASVSAAALGGWRVARIEASEGIRDV